MRRNQLKLSETNASMAIWLGKQWLGQREAPIHFEGNDRNNRFIVAIEDCSKTEEE